MKTTILLADDHQIVRQGLRQLLEAQEDFVVLGEAADGYAAAELCEKLRPDVILMDIWMPHLSGVDATRRLAFNVLFVALVVLALALVLGGDRVTFDSGSALVGLPSQLSTGRSPGPGSSPPERRITSRSLDCHQERSARASGDARRPRKPRL